MAKSLQGFGEQRALFLDRDGVLIHDVPYNTDPSKVTLRPGIENLLKRAHDSGFWIVVVTNQSGLGRGYFSWSEYRQIHQKMCELLAARGQWVDLTLCAPYYEGTEFAEAQRRPHFRKPDVGMFEYAREELGISFNQSVMIGDRASDLMGAFRCGVRELYLVESESQTQQETELRTFQARHPDFEFRITDKYQNIKL